MMDDDECIHGLGPISACTICNGREKREQARRDLVVMRFPAQYASRLACGHEPDIGDLIARMADDRLVCAECVP